MAKVRTQIQFEKRQYAEIRKIAARKKISISEVVRRLVKAGMRHGVEEEPRDKIEVLLEIAGIVKGDPIDLGRKHDEYFVQAIEEDLKR